MSALRIVGFDPALSRTGWGVIESAGAKLVHIAHGVVVTGSALPMGERLMVLHAGITEILRRHAPDAVAVEQAFVAKDPSAALKLGQARAIALLAAAQAELQVSEYAPNTIKKSVTGVGHANKAQIQAMVKRLLPAARIDSEDAADALACAIAHAHVSGTQSRIAQMLQRSVAS